MDYVHPDTGLNPQTIEFKRNDGKRDSLLSWLLPSASLYALKHKATQFSALHRKPNTHKNNGKLLMFYYKLQIHCKSLGICNG